ncbi:isocitrate dehydrogenase [NAD] subunit beta, mitochondrial isoform X2 [Lepeophtheirus salmonis]|uniref:isocitrate dehydrogenase [NAD] subunit beta, mitochondrial isoform X2 n=1 Tax=Lepeophtheirus salmonis TaxID=72036 RepID=UPI001AE48D13|nr:isocitrate dehydrogenase [NAD] subunit beta, mitochondrial-like isoform X2 [Lepeophtheirus salmonis]
MTLDGTTYHQCLQELAKKQQLTENQQHFMPYDIHRIVLDMIRNSRSLLRHCSSLASPTPRQRITVIPGDGVGPELIESVESVFKSVGVPLDFDSFFLSEIHSQSSDSLKEVSNSIKKNRICLKGILGTPSSSSTGELKTLNQKLRQELDLFANVVNVKSHIGVDTRHRNVDIVIIREQIEGEYSALEHVSVDGVIECLKIITRERSKKIAKFAFDYALRNGRKKVTAVHKANIMKLGDGLFLRCCEEMAELYPNIKFEKMIVDNCTMQLVTNPHQFDVLVTPNLYGHIITNLTAGLVGGAGLVPGESYSSECVCFEPGARHAFSGAAGKNLANPTAMLLTASNMLRHLNMNKHGDQIENAVNKVLRAGKVKTQDIGGYASTSDFTEEVIKNLKANK